MCQRQHLVPTSTSGANVNRCTFVQEHVNTIYTIWVHTIHTRKQKVTPYSHKERHKETNDKTGTLAMILWSCQSHKVILSYSHVCHTKQCSYNLAGHIRQVFLQSYPSHRTSMSGNKTVFLPSASPHKCTGTYGKSHDASGSGASKVIHCKQSLQESAFPASSNDLSYTSSRSKV